MTSNTLVDREDAICLVGEKMRQLRHNSESEDRRHIFVFYGVMGIGKTELLRFLESYYSQQNQDCIPLSIDRAKQRGANLCGEQHEMLTCAFVDCVRYCVEDANWSYVELLHDIVTEMKLKVSASVRSDVEICLEQLTGYERNLRRLQNPEGLIVSLTDRVVRTMRKAIDERGALLILIDNVDVLSQSSFKRLEEQALTQIRDIQGVVVVMSSTRLIEWSSFRMPPEYVRQHQLSVFPAEYTKQQIEGEFGEAAETIHQLTGGHPWANFNVTRRWRNERGSDLSDSVDWIRKNEKSVTQDLKREVIDNYILRRTTEQVRAAFLKVSAVRMFEQNMLQELLTSDYNPRSFFGKDQNEVFRLLREMKQTELLSWDRTKKAYVMEPAVRRILSAYMRMNYRDDFTALTTKIVLPRFRQWAKSGYDDKHVFIVEVLYHESCLLIYGNSGSDRYTACTPLAGIVESFQLSVAERKILKEHLQQELTCEFDEIVEISSLIDRI